MTAPFTGCGTQVFLYVSTACGQAVPCCAAHAYYSPGFAVGPALGGVLSSVHLRLPAWAAAAGSAASVVAVLRLLPPGESDDVASRPDSHLPDYGSGDALPALPKRLCAFMQMAARHRHPYLHLAQPAPLQATLARRL